MSSRTTHSTAHDIMTCSLDRPRKQFVNTHDDERTGSLILSTRSNEHSPKHRPSLLTPTNHEQSNTFDLFTNRKTNEDSFSVFSYRSFPHLSISSNGTDSTIVPTTPVDPSVTNLGLLSPTSVSASSISDGHVKKSTSMRFAKLIEHPSKLLFLEI